MISCILQLHCFTCIDTESLMQTKPFRNDFWNSTTCVVYARVTLQSKKFKWCLKIPTTCLQINLIFFVEQTDMPLPLYFRSKIKITPVIRMEWRNNETLYDEGMHIVHQLETISYSSIVDIVVFSTPFLKPKFH